MIVDIKDVLKRLSVTLIDTKEFTIRFFRNSIHTCFRESIISAGHDICV